MFEGLPRRKRRLAITGVSAAVFAAVTAVAVAIALWPEPTYQPGEAIEGLTADLARTLPPDYTPVSFVDATRESGIDFRHFSGRRSTQLPEDYGSGAAWSDFDNDGWLDLFVVNMAGPITLSASEIESSPARSALYRNNGDGTFTDVTTTAGVELRNFGMGVAWADYDNDGWSDLVVTSFGANTLYRNNGDGSFTDLTARAGLDGPEGFWTGAAWGDYDRDGFVDLYIAGYVEYASRDDQAVALQYQAEVPASLNPSSFPPSANLLYRNNGNGTFTEVAARARVLGERGRSLGATGTDFDDDGWPDLYVANDVSDNVLYHNLHDGTFDEVSHSALVADYRGAMGIAVGDWDGDADLDMFVTHWIAQENALYSNLLTQSKALARPSSELRFMDEADRYGVGQIALDFIGWGTAFVDYDNDGRLDLFVTNGSTFQQPDQTHLLIPMRDQLFWNRGPEQGFYDVSAVSGPYFAEQRVGRGAALADYDDDGDVDIFVVNHDGRAVLLRNEHDGAHGWLEVTLEGTESNRSAIGARLRVVAGSTVQVREIGSQASYLSQHSRTEHFGLGLLGQVDTLEIQWPSGLRQVVTNLPAGQRVSLVEGIGR
jgi:hypothetical protein